MRHIREVLRLHHSVGMSQRAVARSLNLAQGTVSKYVNRARRAGLACKRRLQATCLNCDAAR
jgi:DNA-binding transcriptional regulator LsrR (DeoR family)